MRGFYISVSNGLLYGNHRGRMGTAVWEFMWLLDKITSISEEGIGKVLGGRPIKTEEIVNSLGINRKHVDTHLERLKQEGYINIVRAPYGLIITINKAQKVFGQKVKDDEMDERDESEVSHLSDVTKTSHLSSKNVSSLPKNVSSNKTRQYIQDNIYKTNANPSGLADKSSYGDEKSLGNQEEKCPPKSYKNSSFGRDQFSDHSFQVGKNGKPIKELTKREKTLIKEANRLESEYPEIKGLRKYFKDMMKIPEEDGYADLGNLRSWVKIYEKAGRSEKNVRNLIDLAASDEFYSQNITSGTTLWAKRIILMTRERGDLKPGFVTQEQMRERMNIK